MAVIKSEYDVVINRPIEDVWAFVTNLDNLPLWRTWIQQVTTTSEGPVREGTTYTAVGTAWGKMVSVDCEITEFRPNKKLCVTIQSPFGQTEAQITFKAVDGGTKVVWAGQMESIRPFIKTIAQPVLRKSHQRMAKAEAENLKDLLEA